MIVFLKIRHKCSDIFLFLICYLKEKKSIKLCTLLYGKETATTHFIKKKINNNNNKKKDKRKRFESLSTVLSLYVVFIFSVCLKIPRKCVILKCIKLKKKALNRIKLNLCFVNFLLQFAF